MPIEKTLAEINTLLDSIGCSQTMTAQSATEFTVAFAVAGVAYRLSVPKPDPASTEFCRVKVNASSWKPATPEQINERVKQETARRMRALAALIKATLVAIEEGITTMERAFIGDIVVGPQGQTMADQVLPQVAAAIERGQVAGTLALPWNQ